MIHRLGFRRVALLAILVGPFAGTDAALDINLRAFFQILTTDLGQLAEEGNAVPLGQFLLLAGRLVLPVFTGRDRDVAHRFAARRVTNFRVLAQIADDDCLVNRCH